MLHPPDRRSQIIIAKEANMPILASSFLQRYSDLEKIGVELKERKIKTKIRRKVKQGIVPDI